MIFSAMHRRDVLKGLVTGAGALAGAAGPTLAQTVRVRRNIATAPAALITAFRTGVARMQALPASNPRSWQYWANVHGGPNNTPGTWNQCQHGSFFFLPWHRMYLFYLEKVLRSFSGDPNFALPYWNWTASSGHATSVPLARECHLEPPLRGEPESQRGHQCRGAAALYKCQLLDGLQLHQLLIGKRWAELRRPHRRWAGAFRLATRTARIQPTRYHPR